MLGRASRCIAVSHPRRSRLAKDIVHSFTTGEATALQGSPSISYLIQTSAAMDPELESVIRSIHCNRVKASIYVTGGAAQAIGWLVSVPGASNTIVEASVLYSRESSTRALGKVPSQFSSADMAVEMAKAAYRKAADLTPFGNPIVGMGAACALASEPPKRGAHRAFVAAHTGLQTYLYSIRLAKGARSRWDEEVLVSRLLVKALAEVMQVDNQSLSLDLITAPLQQQQQQAPTDELHQEVLVEEEPLLRLLHGTVRTVEYSGGQVAVDAPRGGRVYLPGSFNPLHDGHVKLLQAAVAAAGGEAEGCFELSIGNADKGMLPLDDIKARVAQFTSAGLPLVLTSAPLFTDKALLFTGSHFVVGYDTAIRMVMPKYYGNTFHGMLVDFERLRSKGCSLLVAGRQDAETGGFKQLSDIEVPPELAELFLPIPEADFRVDLSSTELRARGKGLSNPETPATP